MKRIFSVWVFLGMCFPFALSQKDYNPEHLSQEAYSDSDVTARYSNNGHAKPNSYEYQSHTDSPSGDPRHYQSLESKYHEPEARQYIITPHQKVEIYTGPQQYRGQPEHVQYNQPEDPSYHRPQELAYHQSPHYYQEDTPRHEEAYHGPSHYQNEPEPKIDEPNYKTEEPKYSQEQRQSHPSHLRPVPVDPKLPLYFTMYEKRTIQDPLYKYGKGPWRYLTYGHGISYGSKGPGKVFEKGYGYIRALGRDHCKLPEHLCPPRDEKPFEYDGRKEPYFGYRPH